MSGGEDGLKDMVVTEVGNVLYMKLDKGVLKSKYGRIHTMLGYDNNIP